MSTRTDNEQEKILTKSKFEVNAIDLQLQHLENVYVYKIQLICTMTEQENKSEFYINVLRSYMKEIYRELLLFDNPNRTNYVWPHHFDEFDFIRLLRLIQPHFTSALMHVPCPECSYFDIYHHRVLVFSCAHEISKYSPRHQDDWMSFRLPHEQKTLGYLVLSIWHQETKEFVEGDEFFTVQFYFSWLPEELLIDMIQNFIFV